MRIHPMPYLLLVILSNACGQSTDDRVDGDAALKGCRQKPCADMSDPSLAPDLSTGAAPDLSSAPPDAGSDAASGLPDGAVAPTGTSWYVDGSPTGCGGGPCSDGNAGTSEASAFATPLGCLAHMQGGDTCFIKDGTYSNPSGSQAAFAIAGIGGTAGAYTTFVAYPGHHPKLCVDAACTPAHDWPTIATFAPFVRIAGLRVVGVISVLSTHDVRIDHDDVSGGQDCDGNYDLVRLDYSNHVLVDHNTLHDLDTAGCGYQSSAAAIKNFCTVDTVYEYNTITGGGGMVIGIDDKDTSVRNKIRYNRIVGGDATPIREEGQTNTGRADCTQWGEPRDTEIYGNLLVTAAQEGISVTTTTTNLSIHHNTIKTGVPFSWDASPMPSHHVRDNLVFGVPASDVGTPFNLVFRPSASLSSLDLDYNVYDAAASYNLNGIYSGQGGVSYADLAAWGAAIRGQGCAGCELHSLETTCSFVDTVDYRLAGASACKTAGSAGGEVGAYGAAACVGAGCP